jgi:hypothetical protein
MTSIRHKIVSTINLGVSKKVSSHMFIYLRDADISSDMLNKILSEVYTKISGNHTYHIKLIEHLKKEVNK